MRVSRYVFWTKHSLIMNAQTCCREAGSSSFLRGVPVSNFPCCLRKPFHRLHRGLKAIVAGAAFLALHLCATQQAQSATSTANMTVQITITASCTINATTLDFGSNPGTTLISSAVNGSTTVSVTCTNGSPYSIAMDNGANVSGTQRRMKNGANFLNYNLYLDALHTNAWTTATNSTTCTTANSCYLGTGSGAAQSVSIFGAVPAVGSAPATGVYLDTVTMTITY
jgi:spore coat protein U-like protein